MMAAPAEPLLTKPAHDWLRVTRLTYVPGHSNAVLDETARQLLDRFTALGHQLEDNPNDHTDVVLTTALFGEAIGWRDSLLFTGRRRFNLSHTPTLFTLIHATPTQLQTQLDYLQTALAREPLDPADFAFPGLAPSAYRTLIEQGKRGGPIMALVRLLQAQSKSIRIILVIGDEQPEAAYYFDLVGAHPRSEARDPEFFYTDMVLRMVTSVSTFEITRHQVREDVIPRGVWDALRTPAAMRVAGRHFGERRFFTEMVRVADLVHVPSLAEAVANQYSEGCFATWDPRLAALITTVTGSARPVEKDNLTEAEMAVIVGVRADGLGAIVRHVENKRNDSPSSEAVEMMEMDYALPQITLGPEWDTVASVPVVRSKLHGHRGVAAYHPALVEFVPLAEPYYHYPVSCSTEAQARAIKAAFHRAESLHDPRDARQVVFTVLPGHGLVVVEKWVPGKAPFQVLWEYMDAGHLQVANEVPQGPLDFVDGAGGLRWLSEK
jgi:hypothetical protein